MNKVHFPIFITHTRRVFANTGYNRGSDMALILATCRHWPKDQNGEYFPIPSSGELEPLFHPRFVPLTMTIIRSSAKTPSVINAQQQRQYNIHEEDKTLKAFRQLSLLIQFAHEVNRDPKSRVELSVNLEGLSEFAKAGNIGIPAAPVSFVKTVFETR